jgi:hypothetical protein
MTAHWQQPRPILTVELFRAAALIGAIYNSSVPNVPVASVLTTFAANGRTLIL